MIEILKRILNKQEMLMPSHGMKKELEREINECFNYFQSHRSSHFGKDQITQIHGLGIVLKRLGGKRGYALERDVCYDEKIAVPYKEVIKIHRDGVSKTRISYTDGSVIPLDTTFMDKKEVGELISKIHNITFSYATHKKKLD